MIEQIEKDNSIEGSLGIFLLLSHGNFPIGGKVFSLLRFCCFAGHITLFNRFRFLEAMKENVEEAIIKKKTNDGSVHSRGVQRLFATEMVSNVGGFSRSFRIVSDVPWQVWESETIPSEVTVRCLVKAHGHVQIMNS